MAWNKAENKSTGEAQGKAAIGPGAPVSFNAGFVGQPYRDGWDIERAFEEGVKKVTWAWRAIDVIASNQARLPMILREGNTFDGTVISDHKMLEVFNSRSNIGENSFVFRYRLSTQVLLSTRGAFVEVVRGRDGNPVALNLLPPQSTSPVPHPKTFVSHYEVELPDSTKRAIRPENVIWIRRPHPLDPYLSLTPLEAAGLAVEIENLSRLYNRNFLLNDGRPGGLLVIQGELDEDDRNELQTRFRGNLHRTGSVSVISSDGGANFVDMASSPRDAAYVEQRKISKEEILAAFGVPESVIGNASGRTFSNAAEEGRVFWMETMLPHLELVARGFDTLDEKYYVDFDTSGVPILILAKQDRERHVLTEFNTGLISANEYRDSTGRDKVESELSDALLVNPNLTAIGNTEKEMKPPQAEGVPPNAPLDVQTGETPVQRFPSEAGTDGSAAQALNDDPNIPNFGGTEDEKTTPEDILTKRFVYDDDYATKAAEATDRWENILGLALGRFFERQQRVVLEKIAGKKSREGLERGTLTADQMFKADTWDRQLSEDIRPILQGIIIDAAKEVATKSGLDVDPEEGDIQEFLDQQVDQVLQVNETTKSDLQAAITSALSLSGDDGEDADVALKVALLVTAVKAVFGKANESRRKKIAENEALTAYNGGLFLAGKQVGAVSKTWVTRKDDRVRSAHRHLHGSSVPLAEGFKVGGATLRFPKDPLAPPELTIGCRCILSFGDDS